MRRLPPCRPFRERMVETVGYLRGGRRLLRRGDVTGPNSRMSTSLRSDSISRMLSRNIFTIRRFLCFLAIAVGLGVVCLLLYVWLIVAMVRRPSEITQ